jgi:hypothetical protein
MKWMLLIVPLLLSCNKTNPPAIVCDLEDGLEGTIAYSIESLFSCSGTAAVRASVNGWVDSAGVCANDPTKLRGLSIQNVCGAIVLALGTAAGNAAGAALNSKFPAWNCNPQSLVQDVSQAASLACAAVFPATTMTKEWKSK